jgi:heparosan-N-sulfate-glucuronate 5-epimerase
MLQFGLAQHARWKRTGDERARQLFLAQADWAAAVQCESSGVRGSYVFPFASERYGCAPGFRSAMAQGEAISLLLRAYQETRNAMFLDRAIDASVPLTVDLRDGGVLWQAGDDLIFEGVSGAAPSHVLCCWICALWALFELSRATELNHITELHQRSLATLEKVLPCYDSGAWSYDDLLATPTGFRRVATVQRHLLHVTQLNVLLSMTQNELFAAVAERWHRYGASLAGRLQAWGDGLLSSLLLVDLLTVPGGARSVI